MDIFIYLGRIVLHSKYFIAELVSTDDNRKSIINSYHFAPEGFEFQSNIRRMDRTVLGLLKLKILVLLLVLLGLLTGCASTSNRTSRTSSHASGKTATQNTQKGVKYYRVKPGDTLYLIGKRAGYDYHRIAKWNHIKPPYKIRVGQQLKLIRPNPALWTNNKKRASSNKKRTSSQKKLINSNSNRKVLRLLWQWPVKGRILRDFFKTGKKGIDIQGKFGQNVRSAEAGKVVYSGNGLIGYGNLLIIKHNNTYLSAYANNNRLLAKEGQQVKKGQVIAEMGRTKAQVTTLHFEIRMNGKPVNPINYLPTY